jgi:hypothetical protein
VPHDVVVEANRMRAPSAAARRDDAACAADAAARRGDAGSPPSAAAPANERDLVPRYLEPDHVPAVVDAAWWLRHQHCFDDQLRLKRPPRTQPAR